MNDTLNYILKKFDVVGQKSPIFVKRSRWKDLVDLVTDFKFSLGAEVGVERGLFSKRICRLNPQLKLYGIDCWKVIDGYRNHVPQEKLDAFYKETQERMGSFNYQIIRDWSLSAVNKFADESLDFVFIDAAHDYQNVKADIIAWARKVKPGGIVAGHDYIDQMHGVEYGVIKAISEYVSENKIEHLFILNEEKSPSWFFVKK